LNVRENDAKEEKEIQISPVSEIAELCDLGQRFCYLVFIPSSSQVLKNCPKKPLTNWRNV